ncbi:hypothetical protein [Modicisalibacter luteus]|uniref:Uncharacterized protein n=1 Tax=Modicisalibacter luteus TaxID=453962 RepID=A0ABV7LVA2_9GAMM|nr:hypothetical protein [Halomonas lutea]GHB14264.1 hypothetical protein GCM10007159_40810 [Halomonas lutea]
MKITNIKRTVMITNSKSLSNKSISATAISGTSGSPSATTERRANNIAAGNIEHANFNAAVRKHMRGGVKERRQYHVFMASVTGLTILALGLAFASLVI